MLSFHFAELSGKGVNIHLFLKLVMVNSTRKYLCSSSQSVVCDVGPIFR